MTTVCMVCQTKVHYVLRSTCNSSGDWEVLQPSSSLGSMGTIKHNLMWCNKYKLSDKWPVLARTAHTDGCTYRRCTYRWMHIQMDAHTYTFIKVNKLHTTSDLPLRQTTATLTRPPHPRVTHTAGAHCYYSLPYKYMVHQRPFRCPHTRWYKPSME